MAQRLKVERLVTNRTPSKDRIAITNPIRFRRVLSETASRTLVGILARELFVEVHAEAGGVAGMHVAVVELIAVREDFVGLFVVRHVFLDAEVVNGEVEVQRGGHADGREVRGAVAAGADVVERGEVGELFERGDAAGVRDASARM